MSRKNDASIENCTAEEFVRDFLQKPADNNDSVPPHPPEATARHECRVPEDKEVPT